MFERYLSILKETCPCKRPHVMSVVKFGPTALNFGYDFVLLVHFLGHPVNADFQCLKVRTNVGAFEPKL